MLEWIKTSPGTAAAVIAAAASIIGGLVAAFAKFLFDFLLAESFKRRWQIIGVKRRYSAPIVRAVDDLAARIENMHHQIKGQRVPHWLRPLDESEIQKLPFERYFYVSTVYLFAQLICWIEILKREQTYLDFTSSKETRTFNGYINLLYATLSSPGFTGGHSDRTKNDHWIFFHFLSGIGEAMTRKSDGGGLSCVSFSEFSVRYKKGRSSDNKKWFDEIERLFIDLSGDEQDLRWNRIQILWFCLDRFLDLVDPDKVRTTRDRTLSTNIHERLKNAAIKRAADLGLVLS